MINPEQVNMPHIQAEVKDIFDRYEAALVSNDLDKLDLFFWHHQLVVRFGIAENLYGIEAIREFRKFRSASSLKRTLKNTLITTYGTAFATATTEFVRENQLQGRQSQTWVRFPDGWHVVSAHVSLIANAS